MDRFCLIDVLEKLAEEIQNTGSCDSLQQSVDKEESEFKEIEHILERERQAREKIKEMRHKIQEKNEEGIKIIEQGKETIAYLKDQVQEMKAKIIMEEKYITRYSAVKLEEFQSQCDQKENEIKHQLDFHEKFWKEKSDKDITQFKQELNELKDKKEKNLTKLSELSLLYKEYEAVVLSDRIEKEKARQREEQEELELFAACKIQNWWRTVCVQHNLGPYGKKKRKGTKTKKGKGKKK
uniref:IQ domain-containing protein G n=1 Tax=Schistosoma haematobium TaxID=6185 RepID=A0A094ZWW7_SCHHA